MGAMSAIKAGYGLWGSGVSTRTNVTRNATIGPTLTEVPLTGTDVIYSLKITADDVTDVATLTIGSGACAQTTGTPTIADGDGKDFEGVTLPTITTVYAILIEVTVGGPDLTITVDGTVIEPAWMRGESRKIELLFPAGVAITAETIVFTWGDTPSVSGDFVTVTVAGES